MTGGEGHDQDETEGLGRVHHIELEEVGDVDLMALLDEVTEQLDEETAAARPRPPADEANRARVTTTPGAARTRVPTAPSGAPRAEAGADGRPPIRGKVVDESFKVRELERRLTEATSETEGWRKRMGQMTAETASYRRRLEEQAGAARLSGREDVFRMLMPILDGLEAGLASSQRTRDFDSLFKGLEMVLKQLQGELRQLGLEGVAGEGQPFDPTCQEAMRQVHTGGASPGTVVDVVRRGYRLKERLLRPAMVVVEGPAEEPKPEAAAEPAEEPAEG